MSTSPDRDILNIEEAAALLGVSVKTFNKVLHSENIPARKIGRGVASGPTRRGADSMRRYRAFTMAS